MTVVVVAAVVVVGTLVAVEKPSLGNLHLFVVVSRTLKRDETVSSDTNQMR